MKTPPAEKPAEFLFLHASDRVIATLTSNDSSGDTGGHNSRGDGYR